MILFIVFLGQAIQCSSQTGCVPVPYEAVAYMIQFGLIESVMELGIYKYYKKVIKKKDDD